MHTFLTPDPITLEIRNAAGEIVIALTDTQTTTVDIGSHTSHPLGFLDDVVKAFGGRGGRFGGVGPTSEADPMDVGERARVEHTAGDRPTVIVDTDPARDGWRASFLVTVTAPIGSDIRVQAQSAEVSVTGSAQLVDVRTASGKVDLETTTGQTLVQTASGDVTVGQAGQVDVRTASGRVEIGPVAGNALVHTTSGDVRLGAVGGDISARSVSGDVRVSDASAGHAQVDAVSGDVEIGVHAGALAFINLITVSGRTDTDFEVTGSVPDGDAPVLDITVKTTSGDIRLHRAA